MLRREPRNAVRPLHSRSTSESCSASSGTSQRLSGVRVGLVRSTHRGDKYTALKAKKSGVWVEASSMLGPDAVCFSDTLTHQTHVPLLAPLTSYCVPGSGSILPGKRRVSLENQPFFFHPLPG